MNVVNSIGTDRVEILSLPKNIAYILVQANKRMIRWVFETLNIGTMCSDFRHGASQYHITSCCYHYSANLVFGVKPGLVHHCD